MASKNHTHKYEKSFQVIFLQAIAIISIVGGVVITGVFVYLLSRNHSISAEFDPELTGIVGDFLGGTVGAIWSLAGVSLFYLALYFQRKELRLQIEELEKTREVFELQLATSTKQQFENTFFQLLSFHRNIREEIETSKRPFKYYYDAIYSYANSGTAIDRTANSKPDRVERKAYEIINNFNNALGPYFRNVLHILKFIDHSSIENKYFYSELLIAQLSTYELCMIFYNGITHGYVGFQPLIEKYHLLRHLDQDKIINAEHLEMYANDAFA